MKRNIRLNILIAASLVVMVAACKKVPDGFLSDYIRYEELPINVPQGRAYVSYALNPDGSNKPAKIKLLHIYDKVSGDDVTDLFMQKYELPVWTGYYDPKVDTTLELIDAKRKDSLVYPISINEASGQLEANRGTVNLPLGSYEFDLEVTNSAGTKHYPLIGEFNLNEAPFFEVPAVRSTVAMKVGEESTTKLLPAGGIEVNRIGDDEDKIIVRIVDKNGVPFNPAAGEIARRPASGTGGGWLQTMQDYALSYEVFEDRMEFDYAVVPFPLNSLGNGFNYYYRIPTQYVQFDEGLELPNDTYSCNARFSFRAFLPGTYEIRVIVDGITKR
ncbi:DUF5007 domain-containing protein [Parapedobacter tibetensis]|uniref:DUF5007 domain-containing protein n=1 Tax=Parapedobacter tibetensis TaxID=2972951 RepID=UPI00214D714A|nr:DUF5007 domain-containing protein [Parapedobacter tibetensis]